MCLAYGDVKNGYKKERLNAMAKHTKKLAEYYQRILDTDF